MAFSKTLILTLLLSAVTVVVALVRLQPTTQNSKQDLSDGEFEISGDSLIISWRVDRGSGLLMVRMRNASRNVSSYRTLPDILEADIIVQTNTGPLLFRHAPYNHLILTSLWFPPPLLLEPGEHHDWTVAFSDIVAKSDFEGKISFEQVVASNDLEIFNFRGFPNMSAHAR